MHGLMRGGAGESLLSTLPIDFPIFLTFTGLSPIAS